MQGNCCETRRNIPQATHIKESTRKNSNKTYTFLWKLQKTLVLFCFVYLLKQVKICLTASGDQISFCFIVNIEKFKNRITKQTWTKLHRRNRYPTHVFCLDFIKFTTHQTTGQPTTDHLPTDPPTIEPTSD